MKSFGPLYGGSLRYWHKKFLPIIEIGTTQETDSPYRVGKCLVFRAPYTTKSIYCGFFYKSLNINPDDEDSIDSVMFNALKARTAWTPKDGLYDETF